MWSSNFSLVQCKDLFFSRSWTSVSIPSATESFLHYVREASLSYNTLFYFFLNKKQNGLGRVMTQIRYNGQEKFSCPSTFRRVEVTLCYRISLLKTHANGNLNSSSGSPWLFESRIKKVLLNQKLQIFHVNSCNSFNV